MITKLLNSSNSKTPLLLLSIALNIATTYSSAAVTPSCPNIPLSSTKLSAPLLSESNLRKIFLSEYSS